MDTPNIDRVMKRVAAYHFEDGLVEILTGIMFFLIGLLFVVEASLNPTIPSLGAVGMLVVIWGGFFLGRWLVPALKRRLTFPRTGFVAYQRPRPARRFLGMGFAIVVAVATALAIGAAPVSDAWFPLANSLVVGAVLLWLGFEVGHRRFRYLAGVSGLLGAAAFLANLGSPLGTGTYLAAMGLALAASGTLGLRGYLRRAPAPAER